MVSVLGLTVKIPLALVTFQMILHNLSNTFIPFCFCYVILIINVAFIASISLTKPHCSISGLMVFHALFHRNRIISLFLWLTQFIFSWSSPSLASGFLDPTKMDLISYLCSHCRIFHYGDYF